MGLSAQLVPPPAVTLDSDGPVGAAIADATRRHLGPTTPGAAPGGARPVIVVVEPDTDSLAGLADRIAAATQTRGQRIWVVVTDVVQVRAVDDIVEGSAGVDAVVLVDNSHPATAGAALAAWTWLRHDAPSMALGTLRDSTGRVCRVATITAQAPSEPPSVETSPPAASVGRSEQVLLNGVARASALANDVVESMLSGGEVSTVVSGLARAIDDGVGPASTDLIAEVQDWSPGDLNQLQEAAQALAHRAEPDDAALAAAAVTLSKADAAVAQETARTGFSSLFGRRKRLDAVTSQRDEAWRSWSTTVATQGDLIAQRRFGEQLADALPEVIGNSESRWRQAVTERGTEAVSRWLATTITSAGRLQPPSPPSHQLVSRTWGDARPEVRRHLLVPATAAATLGDDSDGSLDGAVSVHSAEGLQRPLALAWLLGLSASSFDPASPADQASSADPASSAD